MTKTKFAKDVDSWLAFAKYDLKSAKWQLKGKIYTSVCYASQQTAEKLLKALVLANGKGVPKVHSLDRLISTLKKLGVKTSTIEQAARTLDKYYLTSRYPGQYGGPEGLYDEKDAKQAIQAAQKILRFVRNKVATVT